MWDTLDIGTEKAWKCTYIDGLVQASSNSIADMELLQSFTKP